MKVTARPNTADLSDTANRHQWPEVPVHASMHAPFAPVAHQPSRELRRSGRRRVLRICGLCEGPLAEQADTLLLCLAKFGNDDPAPSVVKGLDMEKGCGCGDEGLMWVGMGVGRGWGWMENGWRWVWAYGCGRGGLGGAVSRMGR